MNKCKQRIYLAIPYSGHEEASFKYATKLSGELMKCGYIIFSPITHSHPIQSALGRINDWEFWKKQDFEFIKWCDELWVCDFGDWEKSIGVCAEIKEAERLGKKITHLADATDNLIK